MSAFEVAKWDTRLNIPPLTIQRASIRSFSLPPAEGMEEGGLEYEITLTRRPSVSSWTIPYTSQNLVLYPQGPLSTERNLLDYDSLTETEAWKDGRRVAYRPEHIVNSIAAYHSVRWGNEYQAGKAFHIHRPQATDANGVKQWGSLTLGSNSLVITFPSTWLNNARYPVVIDPTFGFEGAGGSEQLQGDQSEQACKYTLAEAGTVTVVSAYLKDYSAGSHTFKGGIYADNAGAPQALLSKSAGQDISEAAYAWIDFNIVDYDAAAAVYHLATYSNWYYYIKYDAGTSNQASYHVSCGADFTNPFAKTNSYDWKVSIHADYTTGGGAVTVKKGGNSALMSALLAGRLFS